MYLAYNLALTLAAVVLFPFFLLRGLRQGKYLASVRARFGRVPAEARAEAAGPPSPGTTCQAGAGKGDAIWLHAVSVGEVLACQHLAAALKQRFPGRRLVVSTTTETGFAMARRRLAADGFFYCPFDFAFAVRRVLAAVRPALLLVAETEFWPNLFREASRAGVPVAVVNARVSDRSYPRYRRFRFFFRDVLSHAALLLAQSEQDARRLRALEAPEGRVRITGNLKYDQPRAAALPGWLDEQVRAWAAQGALVAGSTAAGEEQTLLRAFQALLGRRPGLRLVLAPRRPERFEEVAQLAAQLGFGLVRRSALAPASETTAGRLLPDTGHPAQVLLLDTIGELAGFYRYATVAFVGGSLVPHGGQNVLEAAQFARPVVVGPYMSNFREITEAFRAAGALLQVASSDELQPALEVLFAHEERAWAMGQAALRLLEANRGATARTVELLAGILDGPGSQV
jgi:3-deoxy-D-manno-octulosonic-acid transferase